jgi:hypothetical protein
VPLVLTDRDIIGPRPLAGSTLNRFGDCLAWCIPARFFYSYEANTHCIEVQLQSQLCTTHELHHACRIFQLPPNCASRDLSRCICPPPLLQTNDNGLNSAGNPSAVGKHRGPTVMMMPNHAKYSGTSTAISFRPPKSLVEASIAGASKSQEHSCSLGGRLW